MSIFWILYFFLGFSSWYLGLRRTLFLIRGRKLPVFFCIIIEDWLDIVVIYFGIVREDIIALLLYSIGGALGSLFVKNSPRS